MFSQKSGSIKTAHIEKFSHDGRGIARIQGKTTFIEGALANETVSFQYLKNKRDYDEGRVVAVLEPSPHRIKPLCQHYGVCGGCSLQHLDEKSQIQVKQTQLLDLLRRIGHIEPESIMPPLSANFWHYRHRARLSLRFDEKKQRLLLGFREKANPNYLAEIESCPILPLKVSEALPFLRELLNSLEKKKTITQIEVAVGDEDYAYILKNGSQLPKADEEKLRAAAKLKGFTLFLQQEGLQTLTKLYPETPGHYLQYTLPEAGIRFQFHPTDFTQINPEMNRLMINKSLELMNLNEKDTVLDLFCGLGNFSLPFAKKCFKVIGVEGSQRMVERAAMNAALNKITNAKFFTADLSKENALNCLLKETITKIILDPPRCGAVEIISQSNKLKARCIVYVSCDPATFARDAGILVNKQGFRLKTVGVMDMFPHTAHVESIALFEKG